MNRHQRRATKASVQGANAAATLQLGIANYRAGRYAEAERLYRQVLSREPNNPDALHLIGCVYIETGRVERGVESVRRALQFLPSNAEFYANLATGLNRLNRLEEAVEAYSRSVDLDGTSATVFNDFGKVLEGLGKTAPALAAYAQAVIVDPMFAAAHVNLARMLHKFERYDDAITSLDAAAALAPDNVDAFNWRSAVMFAMKRYQEALASAEQAIAINSEAFEPHNQNAIALYRLGRFDEAIAAFDRAMARNPRSAEVHLNRSSILIDLHRFDEGLKAVQTAIEIRPDYAEAHNNLGLYSLLLGRFDIGWRQTEWRWKCPTLKLKDRGFNQPVWLGGESVNGKTILLYNDQGMGDAINFARYATLLAGQGAKPILAVDAPLVDILATIEGIAGCIDIEQPLPDFDMHCALSSLPLAFNTQLDTIPAQVPYVKSLATDKWEKRLGEKRSPRIGLVWSGNPNHGNDHNRSLKFSQIEPLLDLPFEFYSLQKDVRASDVDALTACPLITPLGDEITTFGDTTALLSELDLLITADTSIAHVAGAIAMPTWVMLPYTPDWRWMLGRSDSPWYPTLRLFRQDEQRNYASVIANLRAALLETFTSAA